VGLRRERRRSRTRSPPIRAKTLTPAPEAFRYLVLGQGESLLAEQFGKSAPLVARAKCD
jgi:hypothetical protein